MVSFCDVVLRDVLSTIVWDFPKENARINVNMAVFDFIIQKGKISMKYPKKNCASANVLNSVYFLL